MVYSYSVVNDLLKLYGDDYYIYTIYGSLVDSHIITAPNKKTAIIKEKYLNEWSSGVTIRLYNNTPKKYQTIIELLNNDEYEKAEKLFYQ